MVAGFPEGTPLRRAMNFTYNHFSPVQVLRTTYKAGPLLALGLACLAGGAVARLPGRWRPAAATGLAVLAAVAAWPLVSGRAIDPRLTFDEVPASWRAAADHVDSTAGEDGRAVVLPGQLYGYYRWGGTIDAILPALAERPVAVRYAVPYADLRAVDLLWTTDALVQQRRALPGQLDPLLDLLSARTVVAAADDDRRLSGAVPPGEAADVLAQLGPPDERWGAVRPERRAAGTLGGPVPLPRVRAWDRADAPGLVRLEPDAGATVVDGSADGLAGLAAFGALPRDRRLAYAGDLSDAELRRDADGGEVVISDSNRRRVLAAARMAQNHGATLAADDPFSPDAAALDLFPLRGSDGQTVAVYDGARSLRMPFSPAYSQFPERRPFAAFDGDPATHWQADRALEPARHWLEIGFDEPRDIDTIELLPYSDRRAEVEAVEIAGRTYDVRPGWNRLRLGLRDVRSLRVRIARVRAPDDAPDGPGGIRELRIPGREGARGAAPAGARRARARGPRPLAHRPHLPVRAHHRRRPVPARPAARHLRRGARARPPGRRARARARDRAAGRARLAGGGVGDRRRARPDSAIDAVVAGARRRDVRVLGPLRGPPGVPGLERVRRHAAAVDRLVAGRPHRMARVDHAGAARRVRELRLEPARETCGGRRACGSSRTAGSAGADAGRRTGG